MWFNRKKKNNVTLSELPGVTISIVPWRLNQITATVNTEVADIVDAHFAALNWYNSYFTSLLKGRKKMDSYARTLASVGRLKWTLRNIGKNIARIKEGFLKKLGFARSKDRGGEERNG